MGKIIVLILLYGCFCSCASKGDSLPRGSTDVIELSPYEYRYIVSDDLRIYFPEEKLPQSLRLVDVAKQTVRSYAITDATPTGFSVFINDSSPLKPGRYVGEFEKGDEIVSMECYRTFTYYLSLATSGTEPKYKGIPAPGCL